MQLCVFCEVADEVADEPLMYQKLDLSAVSGSPDSHMAQRSHAGIMARYVHRRVWGSRKGVRSSSRAIISSVLQGCFIDRLFFVCYFCFSFLCFCVLEFCFFCSLLCFGGVFVLMCFF